MDTLTHIVLGGTIGDSMLGNRLGKRAMFLGALAQSIPDIDFVAATWLEPTDNLLGHRGFTHSFLFLLIAAPLLGWFSERIHRPHNISFLRWTLFFALQVFIHDFIDAFNTYGTAWFEPFNHFRVSFDTLFVADPFFSIWLAISCAALLILGRNNKKRKFWRRLGLIGATSYLIYTCVNKVFITNETNRAIQVAGIRADDKFITPTPLNNWLWFVVAKEDSGYYVGYRSVFDRSTTIDWVYFPKNDYLLDTLRETKEVKNLQRFSQGWYTIGQWGDTLIFNDLRFQQSTGWHHPRGQFAFHYFLQHPPKENLLVVQRGRFKNWDEETMRTFWRRIKGN